MAFPKRLRAAPQRDVAGDPRNCRLLGGCDVHQIAETPSEIQKIRVAHLARRFRLAPGMAAAIASPKDAARAEAIRRWPAKAELFARVKDDGRAEAALIAVAGMLREATR